MGPLSFEIIFWTGVVLVGAGGWWAMVRSYRRIRACEGTAAPGDVERHPESVESAAAAGAGELAGCPLAPSSPGRPRPAGGWACGRHDDVHMWLGAYVLMALDAIDTRTVQEHLFDCRTCRAELAELAALPQLLDRLSAEDVLADPHAD